MTSSMIDNEHHVDESMKFEIKGKYVNLLHLFENSKLYEFDKFEICILLNPPLNIPEIYNLYTEELKSLINLDVINYLIGPLFICEIDNCGRRFNFILFYFF